MFDDMTHQYKIRTSYTLKGGNIPYEKTITQNSPAKFHETLTKICSSHVPTQVGKGGQHAACPTTHVKDRSLLSYPMAL